MNSNTTKVTNFFLGFIVFVIFVYLLYSLQNILIPFTVAVFLTFLFHPILVWLSKYKIPKPLSIIFILFIIFGTLYLFTILIISSLSQFPDKLSVYAVTLSAFLENILVPFNLTLDEFSELLKIEVEKFDMHTLFQSAIMSGLFRDTFLTFSSMLGDILITLIFWLFMIAGKTKFEERIMSAFKSNGNNISKTIEKIDHQIQSYIFIKTILSLATGSIVTLVLFIFDVDFAFVWGLLTFILNYIPNIGSIVATFLPIVISILEYGFGVNTILIIVLLISTQFIIGNLIEPHFLGKKMDLSPVFVLFSLIFWGSIWGLVGMFLAVPIAAVIKILLSNIESLKPFAVLISSKPDNS